MEHKPLPHDSNPAPQGCGILFFSMKRLHLTFAALSLCIAPAGLPPLAAYTYSSGNFEARIDTTVSLGAQFRLDDPDPALVGLANGGTALSVNYDNGNLNYDKGLTSLAVQFTTDIDLNWQDFGVFTRLTGFYDHENESGDRERTPLSDIALDRVGSDLDFLDYYAYAFFDAGSVVADIRLGNQVLNWGESTFIQNGINVINPVDVAKIRLPGSELREALVPVQMLSVNLGLTRDLSLEAFYQIRWEEIQIDPEGSFFSTNDFISDGGEALFLGFGSVPDSTPLGFGARVPRGLNQTPEDEGQFGVALRWFIPALNQTELGFYYLNYHSRLPYINGRAGTLQGVLAGDYPGSAEYFVVYPEDIEVFGLSFNSEIGTTGIAIQGEVSYRDSMPVQVDDVELLFSALSAPSALLPSDPTNPDLQGALFLGQNSQLGFSAFGEDITGFREVEMWQIQATATKVFGPNFGADQIVVLGEIGFNHFDLPDSATLRFDAPATYTSANPAFTAATVQPATTDSEKFATSTSWGYRLVTRFDYNNVIYGVNLSPLVAFSHDVSGITPLPVGNFLEGRTSLTLGLNLEYQSVYLVELRYASFGGAGDQNLISDRDFFSATLKYSF